MIVLEKHKLYGIALLNDQESRTDKDYNYGVVNMQTDQVEYRCYTYPQAQAVAAQFDYMVENNTWKDLIADMFGAPGMPVFMPEQEVEDPDIELHDPAIGKRH